MTPDNVPLQQAYNDTVRAFLRALDLHAPGEASHAERVAVLAVATAHQLGWRGEDLVHIRRAAALHDVGKIAVSRDLLEKKGGLTQMEIDELKLHAMMAVRVVESLAWLEPAVPMIRHHHERWDGSGYPDGLKGDAIPEGARIIAVAEAFDALTWPSAFREPVSTEEAMKELRDCAGAQFDPNVVEAFAAVQPLIQPLEG